MLLTLLAFLFAIGFLVTVHEYGHYRVAKLFDVKILTFSIGFGRPLLQWQRGETRWQIAMLPLGGYVRMLGEDDDELGDASEAHRQFNRQHPLKKIAIVAAGPAANLLLACLLFAAAMLVGMDAIKPIAGSVRLDSKAAVAGLRSGDEILRVSGRPVQDWDDLRLKALLSVGQQIELDVRSQAGAERRLLLDLQDGAEALYDANVLARLGLSPVPLLNRVAEVETGSVAHRAGLQAGDVIQAIDGMPLRGWEHLQYVVSRHPGQLLQLTVLRGEMPMQFEVTPETIATDGGDVGRLGVAPQIDEASYASQKFVLRQGLLESLYLGSEKAWNLTQMTLRMIGNMLGGSVSASHVSGPVGIASMAGESAGMGLAAYLQYLALVSLSLGVLNLLPVPVLDGGHLLYHSVELLRGKPLPAAWFVMGQRIGIALLLALMVLALYNDIHRFIPG